MAKQYFQLLNTNPSADSLSEALCISSDRVNLLKKELYYMANEVDPGSMIGAVNYMLEFCESLEEVIWISFTFGKISNKSESIGMPVPMTPERLEQLKKILPENVLRHIEDVMRKIQDDLQKGE